VPFRLVIIKLDFWFQDEARIGKKYYHTSVVNERSSTKGG
jgi:hypothetical protein